MSDHGPCPGDADGAWPHCACHCPDATALARLPIGWFLQRTDDGWAVLTSTSAEWGAGPTIALAIEDALR